MKREKENVCARESEREKVKKKIETFRIDKYM